MHIPREPSGLEVELFHLVRANEAKARGDTVSQKIHTEAAQLAADQERNRMERFTKPAEPEVKEEQ